MADTACKTCRRAGQKLFLKEERCFGMKCALVRKHYPPGNQKKKRRPVVSEYGSQLKEKQALKNTYGLRERQFVNLVKESMKKGGAGITSRLLQLLESRLDNVVFRIGFTESRKSARQLISHGHICVNGRKISTPSLRVKKGDRISVRPQSAGKKVFSELDTKLKKYIPPSWLKLDKNLKEGEVIKNPETDGLDAGVNLNSIIEFYSR